MGPDWRGSDRDGTGGSRTPFPGKKDSQIRDSTAFPGAEREKAGVRKNLDFRAIEGHYLASKLGEFRQTG